MNREDLIFILIDRSCRSISTNFELSLKDAFNSTYEFIIWDLKQNKCVLTYYCEQNHYEELVEEFKDMDLDLLIPECFKVLTEIKNEYLKLEEKRNESNEKYKLKANYETYLEMKRLIDSGKFKEPKKKK